jgi:hypothetical protein
MEGVLELSSDFIYYTQQVGQEPGQATLFRATKTGMDPENLDHASVQYFSDDSAVYTMLSAAIGRIEEGQTDDTLVVRSSEFDEEGLGYLHSGAVRSGLLYWVQPEECDDPLARSACARSSIRRVPATGGDFERLHEVDNSSTLLRVDAGCVYWSEAGDAERSRRLLVAPR